MSRRRELIWASVRVALGLFLLAGEVGVTGFFLIGCVHASTFRAHIIFGALAAFFAIQGWIIWRVLLSPSAGRGFRRKLIHGLEGLEPLSQEFYVNTSRYFWQRAHATRNYGRFFVLLAAVSAVAVFVDWHNRSLVLSLLPAYLFSGFLGLITIDGALRTIGVLTRADRESDPVNRAHLLRDVALRYGGDPVAVCALRLIDEALPS